MTIRFIIPRFTAILNINTLSLNIQKSRDQDKKGPIPDMTNPTTIGVDRVVTGVQGLKITTTLLGTIYTRSTTLPDAGADLSHPGLTTGSNRPKGLFTLCDSTFSQTHKAGNNGINGNFVFPHTRSFLHYLHLKMLVTADLDVS